jgi:hypothetical protein
MYATVLLVGKNPKRTTFPEPARAGAPATIVFKCDRLQTTTVLDVTVFET